jgi:phosphoenolpyruvate-protein kinase (PTS system EI component)
VVAAEGKLLEVQESVRRTLGKDEAEIFEAQILLLRDVQLRDAVRALCLENRMNVEAAVEEAIKQLMELFGRLEDPYFRERAADRVRRRQTPPRSPGGRAGCRMFLLFTRDA